MIILVGKIDGTTLSEGESFGREVAIGPQELALKYDSDEINQFLHHLMANLTSDSIQFVVHLQLFASLAIHCVYFWFNAINICCSNGSRSVTVCIQRPMDGIMHGSFCE